MKILHIMPSYLPAYEFGGPVKTVHELCASLAKKGLDISVFTTNIKLEDRKDIKVNKEYVKDGVKVTYFPISFPRQYCYSPELACALRHNIRDYDIIHLHSVYRYTTLIGARLCRIYNKPYLLNPFGAIDPSMINLKNRFKKMIYIKLFEEGNIKNAAAMHLASDLEKEAFLSMGFKKTVAIIPPALDLEKYSKSQGVRDLTTKFPVLSGKKIILFLGRIHPKKGLDILVDAFKMACEKRDDLFLVVAGPGETGYVNKAKRLFKNAGLSDKVIFTGAILEEEKISALYESDIFVLPSYGENFGIAVLEAMACGLPVIGTNKVGLFPDIKEYDSGIVTTCNAGQIAKAMLKLLDNEALRKSMGQRGRGLVESRFTNDRIAGKVINIYQNILKI